MPRPRAALLWTLAACAAADDNSSTKEQDYASLKLKPRVVSFNVMVAGLSGLGKTTTCNMLFEQWQQPGHHASSGAKSLLASSRPKLMKSTRHVDVSRCFLRGVEGGASLARLQHARDDHLEGGAKEPQFLGEEAPVAKRARRTVASTTSLSFDSTQVLRTVRRGGEHDPAGAGDRHARLRE